MDKVLSPLAITAFRKFSGKGFSALGHLVWCVMALPLRSCPTRLAAGRGPSQVGLLHGDPSPVLPGLHSAGPPEALPTFLLLLPLPPPPQGWTRLRNRRLRGPWGEVSLVPIGLPPSLQEHP